MLRISKQKGYKSCFDVDARLRENCTILGHILNGEGAELCVPIKFSGWLVFLET